MAEVGATGGATGVLEDSGGDLLELFGRASELSPEKLGALADEVRRLSSRARSTLDEEVESVPSEDGAEDEGRGPERGRAHTASISEEAENMVNALDATVDPALPVSSSSPSLDAPRARRPRSSSVPEILSDDATGSSAPAPSSSLRERAGSRIQGLMKLAAAKLSREPLDRPTEVGSAPPQPKQKPPLPPKSNAQTRRRSNSSTVRRDLYGFHVEDELLPQYAQFMETAILEFSRQTERFDELSRRFPSELLGSDIDEDAVLDRYGDASSAPGGSVDSPRHDRRGFVREMSAACRETVAEAVRDGIPAKYRTLLWPVICGQRAVIELSSGVYERLLQDNEGKMTKALEQIDRDIPRTFPGTIGAFSRESLRRVLVAYSWRDPAVGYCQSMNFIVAGLLTFLDEENAFWLLCHIADKILPDYFGSAVIGVLADAQILGELTRDRLPAVYAHFRRVSLDMRLLASQWFMTLFSCEFAFPPISFFFWLFYFGSLTLTPSTDVLPNECTFRVWDITFVRGAVVLFEVALGLLAMHEERLLKAQDAPEISLLLHEVTAAQFDLTPILEAFERLKDVDEESLNMLRRDRLRDLLEAQRITNA
jgi:Rab-GTPase-TBC domain